MLSIAMILLMCPKQRMKATLGCFVILVTSWWEIIILCARPMDFGVKTQFVEQKVFENYTHQNTICITYCYFETMSSLSLTFYHSDYLKTYFTEKDWRNHLF